MTKQNVKRDPKTELVEPSGEDDIVGGEVISEEVRPVSEVINKESSEGNAGNAVREQIGDDLSDKGMKNGNETEKAQLSVVTDGGFTDKMWCDGDLSNGEKENGEEIVGAKEIKTLSGDKNVNVGKLDCTEVGNNLVDMKENEMKTEKNLPSTDGQVGNGEQKIHEKDVKLEGNQVKESVNPEEKQMISDEGIGDTSLEILVKPKEEQTGVTPAKLAEGQIGYALENPKELQNSDILEIPEENKFGDTSVEPVDNKMENTPVKDELHKIRDASLYSKENQTEDISVISEWNKIGDVALEMVNYEKKQLEDKSETPVKSQVKDMVDGECPVNTEGSNLSIVCYSHVAGGDDSGTEEEQAAFMKELEIFYKEKSLEFKAPKFYGEGLNCLKLWRAVTKLGGYEQVTSCKLWRQVGESFKPPKTCTTISWSFRCFYEKALLEYEKHKITTGELQVPVSAPPEAVSVENQVGNTHVSGSGRARRDSAARAMQGWHSQRLLGNGEVSEPIIKDKSSISFLKRDKQHRSGGGIFKRKKPSTFDHPTSKAARLDIDKTQMDTMVVDCGPAADWVKINVRRTRDCFEVYALVPGLLREEVHVQSDAAGRLVISGEPEQPDNPWGVTPFRKIVTLPSRIDAHQTSAIVTLHGQLFVRAPFEQQE